MDKKLLDDLFSYDPDTGIITRKKTTGSRGQKWDQVGSLNDNGYLTTRVKGRLLYIHRIALIMSGFDFDCVDHINHVRTDNRLFNLRAATRSENARNISIGTNNNTGILGVSKASCGKMWRAYIKIKGKQYHLGVYKCFFEACCARKSAERKHNFHINHGNKELAFTRNPSTRS